MMDAHCYWFRQLDMIFLKQDTYTRTLDFVFISENRYHSGQVAHQNSQDNPRIDKTE